MYNCLVKDLCVLLFLNTEECVHSYRKQENGKMEQQKATGTDQKLVEAFFSHEKIMGEDWMNHSLPAIFFFTWRSAFVYQFHSFSSRVGLQQLNKLRQQGSNVRQHRSKVGQKQQQNRQCSFCVHVCVLFSMVKWCKSFHKVAIITALWCGCFWQVILFPVIHKKNVWI